MSKKDSPAMRLTEKFRSSLVTKLNMRMLAQVFAAFFSIDLLLCLLFFGAAIISAEQNAVMLKSAVEAGQSPIAHGYSIIPWQAPENKENLPQLIRQYLPIKEQAAMRGFTLGQNPPSQTLPDMLFALEYTIDLPIGNAYYRIVCKVGEQLKFYANIMLLLLIAELFFMISHIGKGARAVRKTLRPLSEMAQAARDLNEEVARVSKKPDGEYIKNLAGAISSIDANRLDRRIAVDSAQNELKDLAGAINNMLSRIHEAYRSQVRFVSDASHELRTPISVIQGYANLLDRWGKNDQRAMQESIEAIKSESENMKELVEQLLFLARGDSETMHLNMEVFDVSKTCEEIIKETQMIDSGHRFELHVSEAASINADQQLIKQAIRILMDNSIKYTPAKESIKLQVMIKGNDVHIRVQDNGIGIAPEDLEHIFDRFYRSDESRARKTGGCGLGLAIAKWIVDRHNGRIEVLSRTEIGTRITIVLPIFGRMQDEKSDEAY